MDSYSNWYSDWFLKVESKVLSAHAFVNKDGEVVPFSLADKIVYSYFVMKIEHFCYNLKGEYYETQEQIANVLGIDVQVVRRSVTKLTSNAVIFGRKVRLNGKIKWIYTGIVPVSQINLVYKNRSGLRQTSSIGKGVTMKPVVPDFDDDFDPPF